MQIYYQHQEEKRRRQQREELILKHLRRHISVSNEGDVVAVEGNKEVNQQKNMAMSGKVEYVQSEDEQVQSTRASISTSSRHSRSMFRSSSNRDISNSLLMINEQLNPCAFMSNVPRPRFHSDEDHCNDIVNHSAVSAGAYFSSKNICANKPNRFRSNTTMERRRSQSTSNTANLTKHVLMKYNPQLFTPAT